MSTACVTRDVATALVGRVEKRMRSRMLAYQFVASQIGRSSSWLRGLIGNGVGRVDSEIGGTLDALLVREIEADVVRLEHEMAMARQRGDHPASQQIGAIETHLARVRALLDWKP